MEHVHHHGDTHDHGHSHSYKITNINSVFIIGIVLNLAFVVIEFVAGYFYSSLGLVADAGHNLTDVSGLLISLLAFKTARIRSNNNYTYGYKKTTILASLVNAIILLVTIGAIVWESISRFRDPEPVQGGVISIVAAIGIAINAASAWLFYHGRHKDINLKAAYLHLMADAVISAGVVVAGLIIYFTGYYWVDTVISLIIAAFVLAATWRLLKDSIRLSLDGTPPGIDLDKVKQTILEFKEVVNVHHIHIWALSSSQNALTAHVIIRDSDLLKFEAVKNKIKHELVHLNIDHATLEIESEHCDEACD